MIAISLPDGSNTVLDDEDAMFTKHRWKLTGSDNGKYVTRNTKIAGKSTILTLHLLIMERVLKRSLMPGEMVDHKDGDRLNNVRSNLRLCTLSQNRANAKINRNNTSGFKGVGYYRNKWRATIMVSKKQEYLGLFDTPEEAHVAYCEAAQKYFGEFARFK